MKTSCIRHPESDPYIILRGWEVAFCDGKHCAALLLAFFIAWHDWKLVHDQYYRLYNDIADMHGDGRPHDQSAFLFFTTDQLIAGCMGIYGKSSIKESLKQLTKMGVISDHDNPNPRYYYDRTRYYRFYPEVCNQWLAEHYPLGRVVKADDSQVVDFSDRLKIACASTKTDRAKAKSGRPITNTTNNNKLINMGDDHFLVDEENTLSAETTDNSLNDVLALLKEKGMQEDRLVNDSDLALIKQAVEKGAGLDVFSAAYDSCVKVTAKTGRQFGVSYLLKAVDSVMQKSSNKKYASHTHQSQPKPVEKTPKYENDFSGGLYWMGDLVK